MFRISEDAIVLGSLGAFTLWLFVGLPLLYSCPETIMALSPLSNVVIGFLGGAVMSFVLGQIFSWWKRPIASVRFVPDRGCYVTTARGNPPTHTAHFLRLLIENVGRSPIENCKGYVTSITALGNGTRLQVEQEVLGLTWSSARGADPIDIAPGAFFYMNVACLDLVQSGPPILGLVVDWMPNHLVPLLRTAATFELSVKVVSGNAAVIDRIVRFEYNPQFQDLVFQFD
jgi:hypothetical protein